MASQLNAVTPLRPGQGLLVVFAIAVVVIAMEMSPRLGGLLLLVLVLYMLNVASKRGLLREG